MAATSLPTGSSNSVFESTDRFPNILREDISVEEAAATQMVWAAIERLPTYNRVRNPTLNDGVVAAAGSLQQMDVTNIALETRKQLVQRLVGVTDEDNEHFLQKLHQRLQRFGFWLHPLPLPTFCLCLLELISMNWMLGSFCDIYQGWNYVTRDWDPFRAAEYFCPCLRCQ